VVWARLFPLWCPQPCELPPPRPLMRSHASLIPQWCTITCVVVALPTIGKSTQKAVERTLGSLFGE
jgi:hypothetical protein